MSPLSAMHSYLRRVLGITALSALACIACSGSSGGTISNSGSNSGSDSGSDAASSAGGQDVAPTCKDGSGNPAASCAVSPVGTTCSLGDASTCTPLTKLEVYADDGKNGVCLHLVYSNNCASEVYADTCIATTSLANGWQCWTSSVSPGSTIDVSECHATGKYFTVATTSSGALDLDEQKCPAPMP